jgi:predicted  nucleic acid-binding Zn-ribbon protein
MSLNKKQKKQLELEQKRLAQLRQQLAGAKKQLDDPNEVARLEQEIAGCLSRIERLKQTPS